MSRVYLINGSLHGKNAASLAFLKDIELRLGGPQFQNTIVTVKARLKPNYPEETLSGLSGADAIVLVFPLYTYGLPGALMRLLEDYFEYIRAGHSYNRNARVFMVVNGGFPRPEVGTEAIRVIRNFCRRLSLNWRFAICIGTGPAVVMTRHVPFFDLKLKKGFSAIASDIREGSTAARSNFMIKPIIPEPILIRIKNQYEKKGRMIERKA